MADCDHTNPKKPIPYGWAEDVYLSEDSVNPVDFDPEREWGKHSVDDGFHINFPGTVPPAYFPGYYPGGPNF